VRPYGGFDDELLAGLFEGLDEDFFRRDRDEPDEPAEPDADAEGVLCVCE
jgi:hypothetical protein